MRGQIKEQRELRPPFFYEAPIFLFHAFCPGAYPQRFGDDFVQRDEVDGGNGVRRNEAFRAIGKSVDPMHDSNGQCATAHRADIVVCSGFGG